MQYRIVRPIGDLVEGLYGDREAVVIQELERTIRALELIFRANRKALRR